ncbi:MAG: ABC transporter permease [Litoreibacter sp.]|nr:ABC transporter permease [Litoreibacter sp.]
MTALRLNTYALPLAILVTALVVGAMEPAFLTLNSAISVVHRMAIVGIMAVGMTFVIMTAGIDLSVGPTLALSGLISFFSLQAGVPMPLAILAGLLSGACVGAINGFVVAVFQLPAIIVTLGMLSIVRGSALILGGPALHQISDMPAYSFIGTGSVLGMPLSVWIFFAVAGLAIWVQRYTSYGVRVSSLGDNPTAAHLSGIRTRTLIFSTYVICGTCAALAGIIESTQVYTASANFGEFGTELDVISAVILGGASLFGGKAYVYKTVLGVLFLSIVNSGLNILNVPIEAQLIVKGAIIVAALAVASWKRE